VTTCAWESMARAEVLHQQTMEKLQEEIEAKEDFLFELQENVEELKNRAEPSNAKQPVAIQDAKTKRTKANM
jgi:SMC interacting uncharacterized protein involved in chromosome segregation